MKIAELYIRKGFKEGDRLIAKKDGDQVIVMLDPHIHLEKSIKKLLKSHLLGATFETVDKVNGLDC